MCLPFVFNITRYLSSSTGLKTLKAYICIFIGIVYIYLHCCVVKLTMEVITYEKSHISISYCFSG